LADDLVVDDEFFVLRKEAILFSAFSVAFLDSGEDAAMEGLQIFPSDVMLMSSSLSYVKCLLIGE
jgi:hypothetical protein